MEKKIWNIKEDKYTSHLYFEFKESLRNSGIMLDRGDEASIVAVTSSGEKEGKTFVTLALAYQISRFVDKKVLVVDGGRQNGNSASEIMNVNKIENDRYIQKTDFRKIDVVPDILESEKDKNNLLHKDDFRTKLDQCRKDYSLILIDSRAMDETVHSLELFRLSQAVLYVIEHGKYNSFKINSYIKRLTAMRIKVLGAILNKREFPIPEPVYNLLG